jgi:hypothetical protein
MIASFRFTTVTTTLYRPVSWISLLEIRTEESEGPWFEPKRGSFYKKDSLQ